MAGTHTLRLLRNICVAKFDNPMREGCQGKKDFLA